MGDHCLRSLWPFGVPILRSWHLEFATPPSYPTPALAPASPSDDTCTAPSGLRSGVGSLSGSYHNTGHLGLGGPPAASPHLCPSFPPPLSVSSNSSVFFHPSLFCLCLQALSPHPDMTGLPEALGL